MPMTISRDVKVGLFVLIGSAVAGALIFVIGDTNQLFDGKREYEAVFDDIRGLKSGSPVAMGGLTIGHVGEVRYSEDLSDSKVHVVLTIVEDEGLRIREDSVATIVPKGLLGDQMVEITVGKPGVRAIEPGASIPTRSDESLMTTLSHLGAEAGGLIGDLRKTTEALSSEELHEDLRGSIKALHELLASLNQGDGYVPKLLHDPGEAERISEVTRSLQRSSHTLEGALSGLKQTMDRVNTGPGLVHEVLYGEATSKVAGQFGQAAEEVALTLKGMREGKGLAHSIIYGDEHSDSVLTDFDEISANLRDVTRDLRAGKGTLGALLMDPSVYEDIKMLLGNVERNETLRALVRYSIKQDEKQHGPQVQDEAANDDQVRTTPR